MSSTRRHSLIKLKRRRSASRQAKLSNQQLDAQIAAARANLRTAQYTARNDKVTLRSLPAPEYDAERLAVRPR